MFEKYVQIFILYYQIAEMTFPKTTAYQEKMMITGVLRAMFPELFPREPEAEKDFTRICLNVAQMFLNKVTGKEWEDGDPITEYDLEQLAILVMKFFFERRLEVYHEVGRIDWGNPFTYARLAENEEE